MEIKDLAKPLPIESIDFRIQSITDWGAATILAYKDARVDMQRLDEVCGPLNWRRSHTRDNHNCIIEIWDAGKEQWVGKEDTGTESNTEAQKGLASDSFKRSGFNWGIGRELYDYPRMQVDLVKGEEWEEKNGKAKQKWGFSLNKWDWKTAFIGPDLVCIQAKDKNGKERFRWDDYDYLTGSHAYSINCIKDGIAAGDYSSANEAWRELGEDLQFALWKAPSKGGCFTTEEVKIIKSSEFRTQQ